MKHESSTSTVKPILLSLDVERRIEDPQVRRVLKLFIKLGQADIVECLNEKVKQDPEEFKKILEAVCLYQMLTDEDPLFWDYDPEEDNSITPAEKQLIEKFRTRWPTVRGAIDTIKRIIRCCVKEETMKKRGLRYHIWTTVTISPREDPWDRNDVTKSRNFFENLRPQYVIYYPGLVNLAFLSREQADEVLYQGSIFYGRWKRTKGFPQEVVEETRKVILSGAFEGGYTNYDNKFSSEKLPEKQRAMLAGFDAHQHALLHAPQFFKEKVSYISGWYKCKNTWTPGNPIGSILNASGMMMNGLIGSYDWVNKCDEDSAEKAVKKYGIGYVPRPLPETPSEDAGKDKRGVLRQLLRKEPKQDPPTRSNRDRGSSRTRTESHGKQRQRESDSKKAEEEPPAKKSSSGSKKPAAQAVPSSSRTGEPGASSRR
ncbi:uncharacterized protein EAF01_010919 [Botrytis porri]|uniref:uncharacterized protein n=1 Tax=Botrytis porri TaxID=87229 RepID=UPI00190200B3|nr:uncharacterized protein EAF01_010919 [Botrytis porri]KAF7889426.1 hypothetical protein EAF01_010919 [Botrytis porri]